MVPVGSASISSAAFVTATPSQPPTKALRSIMGARAGCMRRAPKEMTARSPAARLQRAALVDAGGLAEQSQKRGLVLRPLDVGALDHEHGLVGPEDGALVHRPHVDGQTFQQHRRFLDAREDPEGP